MTLKLQGTNQMAIIVALLSVWNEGGSDAGCLEYGMFGIWDVCDVKCLGYEMFRMWIFDDVEDVGILGMWEVCIVGVKKVG